MAYAIYNYLGGIHTNDNCQVVTFDNEIDALDYLYDNDFDEKWYVDTYEEQQRLAR